MASLRNRTFLNKHHEHHTNGDESEGSSFAHGDSAMHKRKTPPRPKTPFEPLVTANRRKTSAEDELLVSSAVASYKKRELESGKKVDPDLRSKVRQSLRNRLK